MRILLSSYYYRNAIAKSWNIFQVHFHYSIIRWFKCQNNNIILTSGCIWKIHNSLNSIPGYCICVSSNILHSLWHVSPYTELYNRMLFYPIKYTFMLGIFWSYAHAEGVEKAGVWCRWFIQGTTEINRIDDAWMPQSHNAEWCNPVGARPTNSIQCPMHTKGSCGF